MDDRVLAPSRQSLEIIARLIGFDTVSEHSNLPLIDWVQQYLRAYGVHAHLSFDATRQKANLFATIGPADNGGIVLSGHTDTVPVSGQAWTTPPFEASVRDGLLYGRGAADMKGFIGVCLALVPRFVSASLARPIHLALTFDEETSMLGARTLVADLRERGIAPMACLVGEPTELKPVVGHKGRRALRCCVQGRSAHSSLPVEGVNAIEHATRIIDHLRAMAQRQRESEQRHYGYDVPYSTIATTRIEGGLSSNTIPGDCAFDFEFRTLPWTDPDALEAEVRDFVRTQVAEAMEREAPGCSVSIVRESELPAFGTASAAEGLATGAARLLGALGQREAPLSYMAFGTEASWFQNAGIPTVVCGPGSIAQAHKPDEFISLAQIARCEQLLLRLARAAPG